MPDAAIARCHALYGTAEFASEAGVLHVLSVLPRGEHAAHVLKIGPASPDSAADAFALSLARARADVIVTTGRILRDEPEMRVEPFGALAASLLQFRETRLGRADPPTLLILTRSGEIDPDHPALHAWVRPIVVTGPQGASRLPGEIQRHVMEVPTVAAAITWARNERQAGTIALEGGPSTTAPLYDDPPQIDETLRSVFLGEVQPSVVGGATVPEARLRQIFGAPVADTPVEEPSGPWRMQRWLRPSSAPNPER